MRRQQEWVNSKAPAFREFCKPCIPCDRLQSVDKTSRTLMRFLSVSFQETAIHFRTTFQNLRIEMGFYLFHCSESAKAKLPGRAVRWSAFLRRPICSSAALAAVCLYYSYYRLVWWQLTRPVPLAATADESGPNKVTVQSGPPYKTDCQRRQ